MTKDYIAVAKLMLKYPVGKLSAKEEEYLRHRMASSEELKSLFELIKDGRIISDAFRSFDGTRLERARIKINKLIGFEIPAKAKPLRPIGRHRQRRR